jgi:hypothetical protein
MMKRLSVLLMVLAVMALAACSESDSSEQSAQMDSEQSALQKADPAGTYGKGITLSDTVEVSELLDNPEAYEGKVVLIRGNVVDVCQKRGCWIEVGGDRPYEKITVKVNDGEIVFPLSAKGNRAVVEGMVERIELTEEQAVKWKTHQAEERGETFDPASVSGPLTIWRIKGVGAEIKG